MRGVVEDKRKGLKTLKNNYPNEICAQGYISWAHLNSIENLKERKY
jgi:hypothetical protein